MRFGSYQVSVDVDRSGEEKTFTDLTPEEHKKCRKFWLKFRIIERGGWGIMLSAFVAHWALPGVVSKLFPALLPTALAVWFFGMMWLFSLSCPRCGAKFSGGCSRCFQLNRVRSCDIPRRVMAAN